MSEYLSIMAVNCLCPLCERIMVPSTNNGRRILECVNDECKLNGAEFLAPVIPLQLVKVDG